MHATNWPPEDEREVVFPPEIADLNERFAQAALKPGEKVKFGFSASLATAVLRHRGGADIAVSGEQALILLDFQERGPSTVDEVRGRTGITQGSLACCAIR
jgi:hypothetical protein